MGRRSLADWQTIIEEQQASGLSIVEYCQQNNLNPKSFSSRKAVLKQKSLLPKSTTSAGFVQVKTDSQGSVASIMLKTAHATLQLPSSLSPEWIGRLLKAVSA